MWENDPLASAEVTEMDDFPEFMKRAANRIATSSQETPGVEDYSVESPSWRGARAYGVQCAARERISI